jgi:hypothetical protein
VRPGSPRHQSLFSKSTRWCHAGVTEETATMPALWGERVSCPILGSARWLSAADAWAAARGFWTAEMRRQQTRQCSVR